MKAGQPKRAIGIVRVSQVKGREEEEGFASPGVQRDRISDVCGTESLRLVETIPEMDVSGSKALDRRKGLRAAIEAVENGRADVIVVAYFDRLVRSLEVQAQLLRRVEEAGGRVLAADIGVISHDTTANWVNATMHGMLAEYHNRITAEKAGAAQRRAIARGIPPMSLPPGLRRVGDTVEVDDELAPVVADAVRLRADRAPIRVVREHLAAHGIERSHHGTASLLKSRLLIGEIVFGQNRKRPEDVWRGTCPAIIDRETWERAQRVSVPRGPRAKSDRLLARLGVLRCASCGSRMVVGTASRGRYFIYRCPPNGDCSRHVTISAEVAERVVVEAARSYLDGTVGTRATRDNIRAARVAVERAQADLDAGIRTLADFVDEPAAVNRLRELRDARDYARSRAEALGEEPDHQTILLLDQDWDQLSPEDRRRCIRATIESALVVPAERGVSPEDRIEVVHHSGVDMLTGNTPPLPMELA